AGWSGAVPVLRIRGAGSARTRSRVPRRVGRRRVCLRVFPLRVVPLRGTGWRPCRCRCAVPPFLAWFRAGSRPRHADGLGAPRCGWWTSMVAVGSSREPRSVLVSFRAGVHQATSWCVHTCEARPGGTLHIGPTRDYPDGRRLPKSSRNAFGARVCCAGACVTARWGRTRSAQLFGHCLGTRWGVFGSWGGALVDRNVILEHGSGRSHDIPLPRKKKACPTPQEPMRRTSPHPPGTCAPPGPRTPSPWVLTPSFHRTLSVRRYARTWRPRSVPVCTSRVRRPVTRHPRPRPGPCSVGVGPHGGFVPTIAAAGDGTSPSWVPVLPGWPAPGSWPAGDTG